MNSGFSSINIFLYENMDMPVDGDGGVKDVPSHGQGPEGGEELVGGAHEVLHHDVGEHVARDGGDALAQDHAGGDSSV